MEQDMRKEAWLALITFVAVIAAAVLFRGGEGDAAKTAPVSPGTKTADALPAQAVLRISPGTIATPRVATPSFVPQMSADLVQLRDRRDWPGLYQRVKNGPQTPEAMYIQAELIRSCARAVPAATVPMPPAPPSAEERRQKFAAGIPENDPFRAQRLAAYDKVSADACGELSNMGLVRDSAKALMASATNAGYAQARAEKLVDDIQRAAQEAMQKSAPDMPRGPIGRMPVSDEQFQELTALLGSRDPRVLNELRSVLASSWQDASLRIGSDQQPVDGRAMFAALQLLGCDLGTPCDAESRIALQRCAYQSQCAASTVGDQIYYYDASPHQAQLIERYRQSLLEMMRSGDFSGLRVVRGPQGAGNTFVFSGGRGP
jgi:hypothetical protein